MQCLNIEEAIGKIVEADARYPYGAYVFIQETIKYTQKMLGRGAEGRQHIAGKELLEGVRGYALEAFGPMTTTVLAEWNIRSCDDVGEIIFNLIAHKLVSKTDTDSRDDFKNGFDFFEAFRKPYLPGGAAARAEQKNPVIV